MIPFIQNSTKCKLIYSERKQAGSSPAAGVRMSGKAIHKGTKKLLEVMDVVTILMWYELHKYTHMDFLN